VGTVKYLASKQIPTCLNYSRIPDYNLRKSAEFMAELGWDFEVVKCSGERITASEGEVDLSKALSSRAADFIGEALDMEIEVKRRLTIDPKDLEKTDILRIEYRDPFVEMASYIYDSVILKKKPTMYSWASSTARIQDPISKGACTRLREVIGYSGKNNPRWGELAHSEQRLHILSKETYWGKALLDLRKNGSKKEHSFAIRLWKRITNFLQGLHDPDWSEKYLSGTYGSLPYEARDIRSRANRFIEMLKTVDGIFLQRYFTTMEEVWTWRKYDLFILNGISLCLGDEFYDGDITKEAMNSTILFYSVLKQSRKALKLACVRQELANFRFPNYDRELRLLLLPEASRMRLAKRTGPDYAFAIRKAFQTRGCGTPPHLSVLRAKTDFISVITTPPEEVSPTEKRLIHAAFDLFEESIPKGAFTGLTTKARITVTTSASWEKLGKEEGTLQAIHDIVKEAQLGEPARVIDLETGAHEEYLLLNDTNPGTYIFWKCLEHVMSLPQEDLTVAYVAMVKEPAKARTITKARASLKIVLDAVSKICSWPMTKIKSSNSGMERASHAWNHFTSFFEKESKVFDPAYIDDIIKETIGGVQHHIETHHYRNIFLGSTDYRDATNYMLHVIAEILGKRWMKLCGIPAFLQRIVVLTCYRPRDVYFTATGPIADIGHPTDTPNCRWVRLVRGVLMGDPLTKIILHLCNIITRTTPQLRHRLDVLRKYFTNPSSIAAGMKGIE